LDANLEIPFVIELTTQSLFKRKSLIYN